MPPHKPSSTSRALKYTGLTTAAVEASRAKFGANILALPLREPWWKLYLQKYDDPVIRILLIAAVIAIVAGATEGKYVEGVGIIAAVLLATTLAFVNEHRANAEFDILNKVNDDVPVKVIREGDYTTVARKELVVGDVVLIEVGEEVPADGRLVEAVTLQVDESKFTGESLPVGKATIEQAPPTASSTGVENYFVLRGSMVVDGHGVVQVTAVGDSTEIGKTARAAAEATGEETPLHRQLVRLSKWIGVVGLSVAALTYAALVVRGILVGELRLSGGQMVFAFILTAASLAALSRVWLPIVYDFFELMGLGVEAPAWLESESVTGWLKTVLLSAAGFAIVLACLYLVGIVPRSPSHWLPADVGAAFLGYFMIAVTLIVVAVPEGLAMSVTLSLAYSMRKMTASNNLVRRMHACETIGATTVICCDKTGTLTLNEMRVLHLNLPFVANERRSSHVPPAGLLLEGIAANSTAHLSYSGGAGPRALGNPTEGALLLWLADHAIDYVEHRQRFDIERQWTFSTERKYMATLGRGSVGRVLHVKGAPEYVLERCDTAELASGAVVPVNQVGLSIREDLVSFQARGMRTLGFAWRRVEGEADAEDGDNFAGKLTWLGFVAMADPIRPEAAAAIAACEAAGVQIRMVTGDNPETAREIGRQIGLVTDANREVPVVLGADFAAMTDDTALAAIVESKILARARPLDKMRIVRLLQSQGHVVAVTGDGTNDAPALNYANVGLAMGKTGTSVAKEASDIVLLDDSFHSIVKAVMWGRSLYLNIQKFILFQLTINVAALGIALLGPFIGVKLPLTVTQMLWVNLIMDTFAALALATEPAEPAVMKRPPRRPTDFIVTREMLRQIVLTGGAFLILFIGFLYYVQLDGRVTDYELTYFFTMFVLLQFWNLFNARCLGSNNSTFHRLLESRGLLSIAAVIFAGQIIVVQFGGTVFRTVPLVMRDWLTLIVGCSVVLWIGEITRWWSRRHTRLEIPPVVQGGQGVDALLRKGAKADAA